VSAALTAALFAACVQSTVESYLDQLLAEVKEDAVAAGFKARTSGWGKDKVTLLGQLVGSHFWVCWLVDVLNSG
jgi:hypothetical protein